MKDEIVKEVCTELKGRIVETWRKGTDRFYNDAKSIISDYSRPQSVASEISRSRSASRDYTPNKTMTKVVTGGSINLGQEYESEESLSPEVASPAEIKKAEMPKMKFPEPRIGGISPMS